LVLVPKVTVRLQPTSHLSPPFSSTSSFSPLPAKHNTCSKPIAVRRRHTGFSSLWSIDRRDANRAKARPVGTAPRRLLDRGGGARRDHCSRHVSHIDAAWGLAASQQHAVRAYNAMRSTWSAPAAWHTTPISSISNYI
jgi:hypothetical protein